MNIGQITMVAVIASISLVGCSGTPTKGATSLEIQSYQSKEYETSKTIAFGAVVSVFQDIGYIIQSADKDTGFITGESPSENKTGFWQAMGGVTSSGKTKATAFVEETRPGFTNVRLNFVNTKMDSSSYGQQRNIDQAIVDPKVYQTALARIDEAIFIRSGVR